MSQETVKIKLISEHLEYIREYPRDEWESVVIADKEDNYLNWDLSHMDPVVRWEIVEDGMD